MVPPLHDLSVHAARLLGALSCLGVLAAGCRPASPALSSAAIVDATRSPSALDRARELLDASLRAHGTLAGHAPVSIQVTGTYRDLGHFERPRELRDYALAGTVTFDLPRQEIRQASSLHREAESYTSKLAVDSQRLFWFDYGETDPHAETPAEVVRARYRLAELVPSLLLSLALTESDLRVSPTPALVRGQPADVVSFTDAAGTARALYVDRATHTLVKSERTEKDDLFGDDRQATEYLETYVSDGLLLPSKLRRMRLWYAEEELSCAPASAPVPPMTMGPVTHEVAIAAPNATVEQVGDGLYTISLEHLDNRTMFLELPEYVVAFETPLTSATGELILATIASATHGKPVRYLALSHYHPDYVGGLRPFVARGTHLVTTPGNVEYLDYLTHTPHELTPDALSRSPQPAVFDTVHGKRTFGEGAHAFEVYDIGKYTGHTDEYLVYYFPWEHLLFEADLIGLKSTMPLEPAGKRATGLLQAIDDLHLDVQRVVESWPLKDHVKAVPIATLRQMVALRQERDRVLRAR